MKLNELKPKPGSKKKKMRVGRGIGSGKGKTSGKGHKGQKARTGVALGGFEGGQMPIYRRLPKFGFSNAAFARKLVPLNLGKLQEAIDAKKIDAKGEIDEAALLKAGIVNRKKDGIKLLGQGEIKTKVDLKVSAASKSAIEAVEKAGGKVEIVTLERKPVERKKPKTNQ